MIISTNETGVYQIKNVTNGHLYIGSAAKSIRKRWINHINSLRRGNHGNSILQNSFNKHGEHNFEFSVLAFLPEEKCISVEQWYIDKVNPYYNICKVAGSRQGMKLTDASKEKLSKSRMGQRPTADTLEKLRVASIGNKYALGLVHTDEARAKMSVARKGIPSHRKGGTMSDETKRKMSESKMGKILKRETVEKIANILRGKKRSKEICDKFRSVQCKFTYEVKTPLGEIDKTNSISQYSKDRDLKSGAMYNTLRGFDRNGYKCEYHKGYKIVSKATITISIKQ